MGTVKGTYMGELNNFIMQYKNFSVSLYKKILRREMDSYGPDESKLIGASMLASTLMLGTIFGYMVISTKDMLSGRSPRDPKKIISNNASICTRWWWWYLWRFFNE